MSEIMTKMLRSFGFDPEKAMLGLNALVDGVKSVQKELAEINARLEAQDKKLNTMYHKNAADFAKLRHDLITEIQRLHDPVIETVTINIDPLAPCDLPLKQYLAAPNNAGDEGGQ